VLAVLFIVSGYVTMDCDQSRFIACLPSVHIYSSDLLSTSSVLLAAQKASKAMNQVFIIIAFKTYSFLGLTSV
jgi:hypothetical protein